MKPLFDQYGIEVVALSKDTAEQAEAQQKRDGLRFVRLLADPKLDVIRKYGLEHHKALEFKTWTVAGMPIGVPAGKKRMAIPTSILVNEHGIIRWIDQADDYRDRGNADRIKRALREAFKDA
jgi:peroxiredoxin